MKHFSKPCHRIFVSLQCKPQSQPQLLVDMYLIQQPTLTINCQELLLVKNFQTLIFDHYFLNLPIFKNYIDQEDKFIFQKSTIQNLFAFYKGAQWIGVGKQGQV